MTTCPRKRSDSSPCVVTDGDICYAFGWAQRPVCVTCGAGPAMTGVPQPADWDQMVKDYMDGQRKR